MERSRWQAVRPIWGTMVQIQQEIWPDNNKNKKQKQNEHPEPKTNAIGQLMAINEMSSPNYDRTHQFFIRHSFKWVVKGVGAD